MSETEGDRRRKAMALFRYGLIADVIHLPSRRGLYKLLSAKAEKEYEIPGSLRRRVAVETLRGWLSDYRRGGFDELVDKPRADAGGTRSIPPDVADLLCELKDQDRQLSVPLLIKKVRGEHADRVPAELPLPESTVHRMLARRGLTRDKKDESASKDHRRFEFESANDLWMSDVMYGPKVRELGRRRQSYLIAFLDDATRVVPHARFGLSEGTADYLPMLEQAVRRRGIPKRLYVDNGSAFKSKQLAIACARLGIALIHARPYSPQGKGKMERWFRTVRMQFLATVSPEDQASLSRLNDLFVTWVESEYHHNPHRGLGGQAPIDRWAQLSAQVTLPDRDISVHFLAEQRRLVRKDRTVTLDGVAFEVDAALVGETVELKYALSQPAVHRVVDVWHRGKLIHRARRVDLVANTQVRRAGPVRASEVEASDAPAPERVYTPQPRAGNAMRTLNDEEEVG